MSGKTAIIIGAGPAGLTAAYELLAKSDVKPVVLEAEGFVGGISRTFDYKGNRMDMGGHRFFSKSDAVMNWWLNILPLQGKPSKDDIILGRRIPVSTEPSAPDPEREDKAMLIRRRLSRIYFLRKFFSYPVSLSLSTVFGLGLVRMFRIGVSFLWAALLPKRKEVTLKDFMVNRFGMELYKTFFEGYTEKVWGVPCDKIPADWGAQRIKGVSLMKAVTQALFSPFKRKCSSISQKDVETSLIEQFIYPKFGPGQIWEEAASAILAKGGEIHKGFKVVGVRAEGSKIAAVEAIGPDGSRKLFEGDFFISTMPVRELAFAFGDALPSNVREVADGLLYRSFRTVGLLVKKLKLKNSSGIPTVGGIVPDTWIYIQEGDVKLGRLQVFNNWSPYLVKDLESTVWLGLEYFCDEGDALWSMPDDEMLSFASKELERIGVVDDSDVIDGCSVKVPKAYPAYFGSYKRLGEAREFFDKFGNLYLAGRNGMHRYNNMDHSMLTAMAAVDCIISGSSSKESIWSVNADQDYHESKKS